MGWVSHIFGAPMTPEQQAKHDKVVAQQTATGNLMYLTLAGFGGTAACPKCGGTKFGRTYYAAGVYREVFGDHDGMRGECRRCGYGFYEKPLDAEHA